jgi:hypothetical protein
MESLTDLNRCLDTDPQNRCDFQQILSVLYTFANIKPAPPTQPRLTEVKSLKELLTRNTISLSELALNRYAPQRSTVNDGSSSTNSTREKTKLEEI